MTPLTGYITLFEILTEFKTAASHQSFLATCRDAQAYFSHSTEFLQDLPKL